MKITGINALGNCLPCGGVEYCVARITNTEGDIPEEISSLVYPDEKERLTSAEGIPENSPWLKLPAAYIFVERSSITQEGYQNFRLMDSVEDFLNPFELDDSLKKDFENYCFEIRAQQANVKMVTYDLDDEDDDGIPVTKKSFLFYSTAETSYILSDVKEVDELMMSMERERFAAAQSDAGVKMVFAHTMEKGVSIFNDIHYHQKAQIVADLISDIIYINEAGIKGHLNITAVENFISNVKDKIRISSPIIPPMIPVEPAVEEPQ